MENYPQELAQVAVCQKHTGHMTGLRFLPTRPLRLNANEWMNQQDPTFLSSMYSCKAMLRYRNFISCLRRKWVTARTVFWHCRFLPFILMDMYLGVGCFPLHISLYHIAAFVLYSFLSMFQNLCDPFACFAINKFKIHMPVHRYYILSVRPTRWNVSHIYLFL